MDTLNNCERFWMNDVDLLTKSTDEIGFLFIDKVNVSWCWGGGNAHHNFEILGIDDT